MIIFYQNHYFNLDIETKDDPLTISAYYNVSCKAPVELKANFETGSSLYDWIMDAGWLTGGNYRIPLKPVKQKISL